MADEFFTAEELAAFREVDRLNALEPVDRTLKESRAAPPKFSRGDRDRSPNERNAAAWDAFVQRHIDLRLETFAEMLGEEIGKVDGDLFRKIEALELKVAAVLHAVEKVQRGDAVDRGAVIDLPNVLRRRGPDAA